MLQAYESTFSLRLILAGVFFTAMLAVDVARHGRAAPRLGEYGFLLLAMLAAVAYGVGHDHLTATISREYFLFGKGLADDPRPFRWAVTLLACRATYWIGLLAGALLLVANNPSPNRPRVAYAKLLLLSLWPLGLAVGLAFAGGALFFVEVVGMRARARKWSAHPPPPALRSSGESTGGRMSAPRWARSWRWPRSSAGEGLPCARRATKTVRFKGIGVS
jgi:hypothetical protein